MKIELQSGSSDFGDFEENRRHDQNPLYSPRKNLWNSRNSSSDRRRSGSVMPKSGDREHDDDFEFVITRSETAKRVKKPNANSNIHHNYNANRNEKYHNRHSYDNSQTNSTSYGRSGNHENNYDKYNNQNNYSKYNNSTGYRGRPEDSPNDYGRKLEKQVYNKVGHPGLERKIDFDPFVSGSNSEEDSGSVHQDDVYTYQNNVRHFDHDFPDQHLTSVTYNNRSLFPKRRYIFLAKIKIFFKFVGVGIKRCYNKSKTYISKVIRKTKDKRRNRKCRDRLLNNQQEPGDLDSETNSEIKTGRKRSQNSVLDSRRSDSPFDLPPNQDSDVRRRFRLPRIKFGRSNKHTLKIDKNHVKQVKIHSFPD